MQEEIIDKCTECGRMWDDDGCRVTPHQPHILNYFVCDQCDEVYHGETR